MTSEAARFAKLGERDIYRGHVISMTVGTFVAPDGSEFERDLVHHPGAVSVVPVGDDGSVMLVRQYRPAIDLFLLELPAGKRDVADEVPQVTASRELAEEIGVTADRYELLVTFYNSPGFSDEYSYVFLAQGLGDTPVKRDGLEEEHMEIERHHLDDVPALIAAGEITDGKTIIGLMMARDRLIHRPSS